MPYAELYKRDCSRPWNPRGFKRGVAGCYGSRCLRDWQSRFPTCKNQHQAWCPYTRPIPKTVPPACVAAKFRASPPCSLDCHMGNHSRFPIPWQTRACIRKFEAVGNSTSVLYCQEISICPTTFWSAGGSLEAMLESGGAAGARHPYALRGGAATSRRRMPLKGTYSTYPASNHGVAAGCENYGVGDRGGP